MPLHVDRLTAMPTRKKAVKLTDREKQILLLTIEDLSARQIAKTLRISFKTVDFHRLKIRRKLDIAGACGMLRYALKAGLTQL